MNQKIALVTGGTRGIGSAISYELAKAGYYVYINCRSMNDSAEESLKKVKSAGEAELINFNINDQLSLCQAKEQFKHDKLDLLVNNAGILKDNLVFSVELNDWNNIILTNFFSARSVYLNFKSYLEKSDSPVVINMGSISGVRPRAGQGAYAVSKAMIIEWTKQEAAINNKIKFYSISPGPVATDMIKKAPWYQHPGAFDRIPLKRFAEPEEIGELAVLIAKENTPFKSGSNIVIDGGFIQTTRGE